MAHHDVREFQSAVVEKVWWRRCGGGSPQPESAGVGGNGFVDLGGGDR